jgi:LPXTG-site transpeptidase (sortase) family protein
MFIMTLRTSETRTHQNQEETKHPVQRSGLFRVMSVLLISVGMIITVLGGSMVAAQAKKAQHAVQATALVDTGGEGFLPYVAFAEDGPVSGQGDSPSIDSDDVNSTVPQDQGQVLPDAIEPTTETVVPRIPDRLVIPAINLSAPVVPVDFFTVTIENQKYEVWKAPDRFAVGWHEDSAPLGVHGNTVLNGHHNIYGQVFRNLIDLREGDLILIYAGEHEYRYWVTSRAIVAEAHQPLEVRALNAEWISPKDEDRLTLITCHPFWSNLQRLIVVASPAES